MRHKGIAPSINGSPSEIRLKKFKQPEKVRQVNFSDLIDHSVYAGDQRAAQQGDQHQKQVGDQPVCEICEKQPEYGARQRHQKIIQQHGCK